MRVMTMAKIPKQNLLPIDELNTFAELITDTSFVDDDGVTRYLMDDEDIIDELLDLFLLAVARGELSANDDLSTNAHIDTSTIRTIVNKEIAGKTWKERVLDYLHNGGTPDEIIRVADTEMMRDFNETAFETAVASGVNCKKRWVTMMDEKVRDTHSYIEGVVVGIDDRFYTFDGDSARYPNDFGLAENNINCRCCIEYVKE